MPGNLVRVPLLDHVGALLPVQGKAAIALGDAGGRARPLPYVHPGRPRPLGPYRERGLEGAGLELLVLPTDALVRRPQGGLGARITDLGEKHLLVPSLV